MTCSWAARMMYQLPAESRTMCHFRNDPWVTSNHLQAEHLDQFNQMIFLLTLIAQKDIKPNDFQRVIRKRPKPIERPTVYKVEKPKPKFLTGKELKAYLSGMYNNKIQ